MFTRNNIHFILILLTVMIMVSVPFSAFCETNLNVSADENGYIFDDSWYHLGYIYGSVAFAIPNESYQAEVSEEQKAAGILLVYGNDDYCMQLRRFEPAVTSYDDFKNFIQSEPTADVRFEERQGKEILFYRNTNPSAYGELFGIALQGTDGALYKISIFTGESEAYEEDAPVWKIAEIIAGSTTYRDFSEWGISTEKAD